MEESVPIGLGADELHVLSLRFADAASLHDRFERQLDDASGCGRDGSRPTSCGAAGRSAAAPCGRFWRDTPGSPHATSGSCRSPARPAAGLTASRPSLPRPAVFSSTSPTPASSSWSPSRTAATSASTRSRSGGRVPLASTARSWLADPETRALERLPPEEREHALLRLWTLKEAYLKAVGIGLNADPREVVVDFDRRELQAAPRGAAPGALAPVARRHAGRHRRVARRSRAGGRVADAGGGASVRALTAHSGLPATTLT